MFICLFQNQFMFAKVIQISKVFSFAWNSFNTIFFWEAAKITKLDVSRVTDIGEPRGSENVAPTGALFAELGLRDLSPSGDPAVAQHQRADRAWRSKVDPVVPKKKTRQLRNGMNCSIQYIHD